MPPSNKLLNGPQSFVSLLGREGMYAAVCHITQVEKVIAYIAEVNSAKSERLCIATGGVEFLEDEKRWMYVMSCVTTDQDAWEGFEGSDKVEDDDCHLEDHA